MNTADKARVGPAADGPAPPEEEEGEAGGKGPAADATPGPSAAFRLLVTRREPAVKLQYAVSGLEPLAWSEDHRVSVSTARSIAVLELICDVHNPGQDLVIHRTSVPAPLNSCLLKVGSKAEVAECKEKFATSKDPTISQTFMLDRACTRCRLSP
ncbi:general transcription factor IIIC subunit 4 [Rhinolophus ferrumequinum]|uniref:General transcription factor IIIC subunit 4 n=1 Tax=Rhinolophus ferrumequinum TaxID=59479 RepID=A0A7J7VQK0_RHIFE|nr:general transcription factor IIIC subunit 4 [Rhinolophus ferrumequinum]